MKFFIRGVCRFIIIGHIGKLLLLVHIGQNRLRKPDIDEAQALHHAKLENIKTAKAMIADSELIKKIKS